MQRQIKFRAWSAASAYAGSGEMLGWEDIQMADFMTIMTGDFSDDEMTLMQFTGLKDKNGVEIYEGDILSVCNGSINGVQWMEKPYAVEYVLTKGFNICMFCWIKDGQSRMDSTHWCEVIGNIYETPELLNADSTHDAKDLTETPKSGE